MGDKGEGRSADLAARRGDRAHLCAQADRGRRKGDRGRRDSALTGRGGTARRPSPIRSRAMRGPCRRSPICLALPMRGSSAGVSAVTSRLNWCPICRERAASSSSAPRRSAFRRRWRPHSCPTPQWASPSASMSSAICATVAGCRFAKDVEFLGEEGAYLPALRSAAQELKTRQSGGVLLNDRR